MSMTPAPQAVPLPPADAEVGSRVDKTLTRWWTEPVPSQDAYALYVLRYTLDAISNEVLRAEHLTADKGWVAHAAGDDITPLAVADGGPLDRQATADAMTASISDVVTRAFQGQ